MTGQPPRRQQLVGIQAARGVAALMVVAFHATLALGKPQYLNHVPLGNVFGFGHAGVDFFFVLSGFLISYVHGPDVGQPHRLGRYVWRRFNRIFPFYWLITAAVIAHDLFVNAQGLRPLVLLEAWTLIPTGSAPLIPPAWTLEHELLFYFAFALVIRHRGAAKFVTAGCLLLVFAGACVPAAPWPFRFLASPYHIQFLLGIAAARIIKRRANSASFRRHDVRHPLFIILAGGALFAVTAALDIAHLVDPGKLASVGLYGLGSALLIVGIAAAEQAGLLRCGRLAETFGAISYSFYLTNLFVVGGMARVCANLDLLGTLPDWLIVAGQIGASLIVALGMHLLIEKPLRAIPGLGKLLVKVRHDSPGERGDRRWLARSLTVRPE